MGCRTPNPGLHGALWRRLAPSRGDLARLTVVGTPRASREVGTYGGGGYTPPPNLHPGSPMTRTILSMTMLAPALFALALRAEPAPPGAAKDTASKPPA